MLTVAAGAAVTSRRRVPTPHPLMSVFLDISTGAGLAGATGVRPYLPPLLAGALARGDIGHRLRRHRLAASSSRRRSSRAVLALGRRRPTCARAFAPRRTGGARSAAGWLSRAWSGVVLGALLFAGRARRRRPARRWLGLVVGPLCAALGWLAVGGLVERVRARLEPDAGGAAHRLRGRRRAAPRGDRDLRAAARDPRHPRLRRAAARRAPARGREVRRACGSFGSGRAEEARPRGHRLAEAGHARPGGRGGPGAGARGAARPRHLHPRLRVDLPVGHARGLGRDRHRLRARASTTSRR